MSTVDPLIEDYLRRLDRAAAALPPDRRSDLLDEIAEHIAVARASGAGDDEAAVRTVLARLGEPEEIVAAADEDVPTGWGTRGPYAAGGWSDAPPLVPKPRGTGAELAAVLMLTLGSLVPIVGWLVGAVLLWMSSLWRVREKLLGTLVVPLGPGVALFGGPLLLGPFGRSESCSTTGGFGPAPGFLQGAPVEPSPAPDLPSPIDGGVTVCEVSGLSGWVALPLTLVLVVAPIVVAIVLYRIARRRAAQAPPTMVPAYGVAPSPWGPLEISAVLLLGLGSFLVPFVGALVGLVLACVSRRWTVRDKVVAGVLVLSPAVLMLVSFVLPLTGSSLPGGWEVLLLLLVAGPVAAGYLAVVLSRRTAASTPPAAPGPP
jgi:hypothetical protein